MIEKLPTPYGLVRYGVAPDHPEVKNVINDFEKLVLSKKDQFTFLGNVQFGKDVTYNDLKKCFDVIVLCYGTDAEIKLNIPGEHLIGVESARDFVNWYNGFPDLHEQDHVTSAHARLTRKYKDLLSTSESACIIGQGNVALDVARILSKDRDELQKFDIPDHVLNILREHTDHLRDVYLIGRRGPLQSACTTKELRELTKLTPRAGLYIDPNDLEQIKDIEIKDRAKKRLIDIMKNQVTKHDDVTTNVQMKFLHSPVEFLPKDDQSDRLGSIKFQLNNLVVDNDGNARAVGTDQYVTLKCDVAFRSIGYKSIQVDKDIPFDEKKGIVCNVNGKVDNTSSTYVSGWLKRGPTGVILSNIYDAQETVEEIEKHLEQADDNKGGQQELLKIITQRNASPDRRVVVFDEYLEIDKHEKKRGSVSGKIRDKVMTVREMIDIAHRPQGD
ncbi:hypothetical protein AKO1_014226, partial [Acrasis kona]